MGELVHGGLDERVPALGGRDALRGGCPGVLDVGVAISISDASGPRRRHRRPTFPAPLVARSAAARPRRRARAERAARARRARRPRARAAPTHSAGTRPLTKACGDSVAARAVNTVASTATPSTPPSSRIALLAPEAWPACSVRTDGQHRVGRRGEDERHAGAAEDERARAGSRRSVVTLASAASQPSAIACSASPATMNGRLPQRAEKHAGERRDDHRRPGPHEQLQAGLQRACCGARSAGTG